MTDAVQKTTADVPALGSKVERIARALARAEGMYLDGGGIYSDPEAQWRDHWRWYLGGRGRGGTCDHSNQAKWERQARAALGAMQEMAHAG